jgi:hypothetical protein
MKIAHLLVVSFKYQYDYRKRSIKSWRGKMVYPILRMLNVKHALEVLIFSSEDFSETPCVKHFPD